MSRAIALAFLVLPACNAAGLSVDPACADEARVVINGVPQAIERLHGESYLHHAGCRDVGTLAFTLPGATLDVDVCSANGADPVGTFDLSMLPAWWSVSIEHLPDDDRRERDRLGTSSDDARGTMTVQQNDEGHLISLCLALEVRDSDAKHITSVEVTAPWVQVPPLPN